MSDRLARMMALLGLPWLVIAVFSLSGNISYNLGYQQSEQAACLGGTIVASACMLGIWRHYISWNKRRVVSTIAMTTLTIVQIVLWKPIISTATCGVDDALRLGQSSSMLGIWMGACSLIWWSHITRKKWSKNMSPDTVRLCVSLSLIPFLLGALFITGGILMSFGVRSDPTIYFVTYEVCAIISVVTWLLVWRSRANWSRRAINWTIVFGVILVISPSAVFLPSLASPTGIPGLGQTWDILRYCIGLFALTAWFAGTAWAWRSGAASTREELALEELSQLFKCPNCSYNMTGLREVRCPECGWTSTIDDAVRRSLMEIRELQSA